MVLLNSKEESLIHYMQKSDEHLRKGVSLIVDRGNPGRYFDAIESAGLLDAGNNPVPVQTGDGDYWHVPYWIMLDYLVACAKQAEDDENTELSNKVLQVIRSVSRSIQDTDGENGNYHTFRVFADIIGLVPIAAVTEAEIDLIPAWLGGRFDRGGVCRSLDEGVLSRFLNSDSDENWRKALRIVKHCLATVWVEKEGYSGGVRREPETLVDDFWLKNLIHKHAGTLGKKLGQEAVDIFRIWVGEIYQPDMRGLPSYVFRPAIEEHEQNHSWDGVDNCCVEAMRDALAGWVNENKRDEDVLNYIQGLLDDELEIYKRIALYQINVHWDQLGEIIVNSMGAPLFDPDLHHELYLLLSERFIDFSAPLKEATVDAIASIPLPVIEDGPEIMLARIKRRWLTAIIDKGFDRADQLHASIVAQYDLGHLSRHPDFLSYSESWSGPGQSPYAPLELAEMNRNGTLISALEEFQPSEAWGPEATTKRALVDSLSAAVMLDPSSFIKQLPNFLTTERCYQYGVVSGFKEMWDQTEQNDAAIDFDWCTAWSELFSFFDGLVSDDAFWEEDAPVDQDMTPTRDWIPGLIADFNRAGTRDDNKAYPADLLGKALPIIDRLLIKGQMVDMPSDDAMTQAINSQKGKAVEALYGYALRMARVADKSDGNHDAVWVLVEPIFNRELGLCHGANFEFSTLLGSYLANLEYLSSEWLESHVQEIFSEEHPDNFVCVLGGLAYGQATRHAFKLLRDNNVFDTAICMDLPKKHARQKLMQRIALGYIWGDEPLNSSRFNLLFDNNKVEDLQDIATFFWSISNQDINDEQIAKIIAFWVRCIEWADSVSPAPKDLLANLSLLSCYLSEITEDELPLLMACVPYVNENNYAWELTKKLSELASKSPVNVVQILDRYLESYRPYSDYRGQFNSLIRKLAQGGERIAALRFAEALRHLHGMDKLYLELVADDG